MSEVVSLEERRQSGRLSELEKTIETGVRHFLDVGIALTEIRESRLHARAGYSTFEAYCKTRWGFTRRRAYQLMEAATVSENVNRCTQDLPPLDNEAQTRELARLPAEEQGEAWAEAVADAPEGKASAPIVRAAVNKRLRESAPSVAKEDECAGPTVHSYRNKETEARDKRIASLLAEGFAPYEIAEKLGCRPHTIQEAKQRLGITGKRKNPMRGLMAQTVEFTDALRDARRTKGAWAKATTQEICDCVEQLEALVSVTKTLIGALGAHAQRRTSKCQEK